MKRHKNYEINFIATVITPWHLIGLKSYLLKLKDDKKSMKPIKGILFIEKHPKNGYLIEDSLLQFEDWIDCHCFFESGTETILKRLNETAINSNEVHVITPCFPEIILCQKVMKKFDICTKSIVIDEGVGCYDISLVRWAKSVFVDTQKISASAHFVLRNIYQKLIRFFLRIPIQKFTLFRVEHGQICENTQALKYYKVFMSKQGGENIVVPAKRYVIIFTNPLEEEGHFDNSDLKAVYTKISKLLEQKGYKTFFRLHPRETLLSKYEGLNLMDGDAASSENLLCRLDIPPSLVIGAHTTSLVTAELFYNIPAFTIGKLLYPYCKTEYCKDLIDKYNKNFNNIIHVIQSYEDLDEKIENIEN